MNGYNNFNYGCVYNYNQPNLEDTCDIENSVNNIVRMFRQMIDNCEYGTEWAYASQQEIMDAALQVYQTISADPSLSAYTLLLQLLQ